MHHCYGAKLKAYIRTTVGRVANEVRYLTSGLSGTAGLAVTPK